MEGNRFLKEKYGLHNSQETDAAARRTEKRTGEKVPNDPAERIEAYLKRLEKLVLDPAHEQKKEDLEDVLHTERPRVLRTLRNMVMNEYVRPNKERMAEAAAQVEERAARQMGIQAEYNEDALEQRGEIAVGDLESSLDEWIKYLSNPDEPYPTWFRYYVFRNILNLGEYDKDKQEFPKRSKGTFKLFPDVDRGALAHVQQMIEASQDNTVLNDMREAQKTLWDTPEKDLLTREKAKAFTNLSFAKQYAEGIKQNGEILPELRAETRGEWVRYKKGEDPKSLWLSLQNKGTAWCTKGYPTAKTQLKGGDFYVYYTLDTTGNPTIPRIAIRMEGDKKIAENPRGVFDSQQNLEPNMVDILDDKLKEFGAEANVFKKKSEDMRMLTALEKKRENKEPFTKDDLILLYEINGTIEGFGYDTDPRIEEILSSRDQKEDLSRVFGVSKDKISTTFYGALKGGIVYHHGTLDLSHLTSAEGLKLPETVSGELNLRSLTSAEGLKLPETIGGHLDLSGLTSAEGLKLPETVSGYLYLFRLTSDEINSLRNRFPNLRINV